MSYPISALQKTLADARKLCQDRIAANIAFLFEARSSSLGVQALALVDKNNVSKEPAGPLIGIMDATTYQKIVRVREIMSKIQKRVTLYQEIRDDIDEAKKLIDGISEPLSRVDLFRLNYMVGHLHLVFSIKKLSKLHDPLSEHLFQPSSTASLKKTNKIDDYIAAVYTNYSLTIEDELPFLEEGESLFEVHPFPRQFFLKLKRVSLAPIV